ncbi:MAG: HEAT repeat domain-containing protein, partial [Anaerolineales bacterium]
MEKKIKINDLINGLLDISTPINPLYLYRLSDLSDKDLEKIKAIWHQIPTWRRQALLEDTEMMAENDTLLSFEALGRFALDDPDAHVRALAIRNLWEVADTSIIPKLLTMLTTDQSEEVRANAASSLGQFVYLGEIEELKESILHQIEEALIATYQGADTITVRRRALEALGFSSRAEVDEF